VCDRLPLLAGDDLQGLDRRLVERHLIGCPQCRERQTSLGQAMETLRIVATTSSAAADSPSLWNALERQIRESRRPVPAPAFALPFAFAWPRLSFRPALGLGLGLLAMVGFTTLATRNQISIAEARMAANERPIVTGVTDPGPRLVEASDPRSRAESPAQADGPLVDVPPAPPHFDYDLDHGRPMPPEGRDSRDTKATY